MKFHLIDGKMTRIESRPLINKWTVGESLSSLEVKTSKSNPSVITWKLPSEPTIKSNRDLMDIPMMPSKDLSIKPTGIFAKSSMLAGLSSMALMTASAGTSSGIVWDSFINYVYPWFLEVAKVFCIIKVAQTLYQNQSTGSRGGEATNFGAILSWGKWYAIFLFLPFVVELIEGASQDMLKQLRSR